jgi:hypothetical protein
MHVETLRRVTADHANSVNRMPTEYHRAEPFVHREIAREHLLIALRRDAAAPIFALTPTAAAIWDRLDTWVTLDALVAHVRAEFEVDRALAESDVREFLEQLQMANALVTREGDA